MDLMYVKNYFFILAVVFSVNFVVGVLKGIVKPDKKSWTYIILIWIGGIGSLMWLASIILLPFIAHWILFEWGMI